MLQQIEQFRAVGEQFMIQRKDAKVMDDVEEENEVTTKNLGLVSRGVAKTGQQMRACYF